MSFHRLLLKNKKLLKVLVHKIRLKNLPLNNNTCVCSEDFFDLTNRRLQPDEISVIKTSSVGDFSYKSTKEKVSC